MAVSLTGSASAASTSVTLPAHNVGDLIVLYVWRNNTTTAATIPTAGGTVPTWTNLGSNPSGTNNAGYYLLVWAIATATNHTTGTFTNATSMAALVFSGADQTNPIVGRADNSNAAASTQYDVYYPYFESDSTTGAPTSSWPQRDLSGASKIVSFTGGPSTTTFGTTPSGWTRVLTDTTSKICINSLNSSTTSTSTAQSSTGNTSSAYNSLSIEVLAAASTPSTIVRYKGQLTTKASSGTIPPHAVGDLIIAWAANITAATTPTAPSAGGTVPTWTSIYTNGTNVGVRLAYAVATATNHTSGTWTNAGALTFTVLSRLTTTFTGLAALSIGSIAGTSQASTATHTSAAISSTVDRSGAGMILYGGHCNTTIISSGSGNGYSNASGNAMCSAPKWSATDGTAMAMTATPAAAWASEQVEIIGNIGQSFFNCA